MLNWVGMWDALSRRFAPPILAQALGVTLTTLDEVAQNRAEPSQKFVDDLADICALHGITPTLHVYSGWKDHQGIMVSATPAGWKSWSLNSGSGWSRNARWIGRPSEELKDATKEALSQAQSQGWPW